MSDSIASRIYAVGEVPYGERLHRDTSRRVGDLPNNEYLVNVKAKERPVLICDQPSGHGEYPVMEFTTRRPENHDAEFALHENGKPRSFGRKLGFSDLCYLRVYPMNLCPGNKLRESDIDRFPPLAMQAFRKMYMDRLLRAPSGT